MSGLLQNLIADRALARPDRLARMLRELDCRRGDRVVLVVQRPAAEPKGPAMRARRGGSV